MLPRLLLNQLRRAARAISQDCATLASTTLKKICFRLIDDLGHLVLAGGDDQDVEAAESIDRGFHDRVAVRLRVRAPGEVFGLAAKRPAVRRDASPVPWHRRQRSTTSAPVVARIFAAIAPTRRSRRSRSLSCRGRQTARADSEELFGNDVSSLYSALCQAWTPVCASLRVDGRDQRVRNSARG